MSSGKKTGDRTATRPVYVSSGRSIFSILISIALTIIILGAGPPAVPAQNVEAITVLGKIPTDGMIDQVALAPGSGDAYGIAHLAETLYVFDLETYQVREKVALGRKPVGLAVDPQSNRAYVIAGSTAHSGSGGILWVLNSQGRIEATCLLADTPQDLALDPGNNRIIFTVAEEKKLLILSQATLEKIKEIPLPFCPRCLALDPDTGRAVITVRQTGSNQTDRMAVLDLETGAILREIALPENVEGVALATEKDVALTISREKIFLLDINQGRVLATLAKTIPHYKKIVGKGNRFRSNEYFGLEVNPATQMGIVAGGGGFALIDLDTGTGRPFSRTDIREIRAVAVDRFRNTLLGFFWTPGAALLIEKGVIEIQLPNPVPELAALTPPEVVRDLENQSITVAGNGLLLSSAGYLAAQGLPLLFLDNHHLQLQLLPEAVSRAGLFNLSVANPAPEGGRSNSLGLLVKNPVPALTGLNPGSVPAGHPGLVLDVFGTGFLNDSTLLWNGSPRPFSLVSGKRLQVSLGAADLETGAEQSVAVSNPGPGGGLSNAISFSIRNPEPLLYSLTPQAARAGEPAFTLALAGSGLVRTSMVYFNQTPVTTTYIDTGRLEARIPAELIRTLGIFPVRVVNPGPGGGSSGTMDFLVSPVALLPVGSFGKKYEDLVPADASLPAYDPRRFSLVTGLVNDLLGNGLVGVEVTLHGRPEYGTAQTGPDGRFSLPVDGGGMIVLNYRKSGYLTAHRQVEAPWNGIARAENVTLIREDSAATAVVFDGHQTTISRHTGTTVADDRGPRALTMVFTGDNRAWVKDVQGNEQPLTNFTVRATEYTTPESMPAKLPPNSAFTYCAELAVDGVDSVRFEKPVTVFVDNFLGFPVGEVVPLGFYDREKGAWRPADNGRVVRLLDTNGDGTVDAYTPDGLIQYPAPGLTDPNLFAPNSTFWRVEISHFTPWDCNWPYGPPPGALEPNPPGPPTVTRSDPTREVTCINSYVDDRGGIFHEDLPLPGTEFLLHYASDRTPGYKPRVTIPASGPEVPANLLRIIVKMELAGRTYETVLPPQPNRQAEFVWDGLDSLGREVTGATSARIRIGFEYPTVYYTGSSIYQQAFAQPGSTATWVQARENIIAWRESTLLIDRGGADLARGWTLSAQHLLNPGDPGTLHKGDGTKLKNNVRIITTAATAQRVGDGLSYPRGVVVDQAGNIYFTDGYNSRYMKVTPAGEITYYSTVNTPIGAFKPFGLARDGKGNLLFTHPEAYNGDFVGRIDPAGEITIIAGNRQKGFGGDGGPATAAQLNGPEDLAADAFGNIYIADTNNHRIRKIDPNGVITTIAGNGESGFSGDGEQAVAARLKWPRGVAVDLRGNIYVSDSSNYRLRRISPNGIITTIAGTGQYGFSGDGGPAVQARLGEPRGLAVDGSGNIYFADQFNQRIRKVDTGGIIATVAGNGEYGNDNGEGGPAVQATVHEPMGVALDSAGNLYGSISGYGKIKKISFPGALFTPALSGDTLFADENGQGYAVDGTGAHRSTFDLVTGKTLLTFDYDAFNRLAVVTDRFGNRTSIERDGSGRPLAITAADGQVTRLTVDGNRHLTGVTYPDGAVYAFDYTDAGLLLNTTDPRGRRFGKQYEAGGLLTVVGDPEGGAWDYTRTVDNTGEAAVTLTTAEGNTTIYRERTDATGAYTALRNDPSGAVATLTRSADELTETEQVACGMTGSRKYGLDPVFRYRYAWETTRTSPAGLLEQQRLYKTYQDTNADRILDRITRTISLNGSTWTSIQDTLAGTVTDRSPLGRTVTRSYDPANLLTRTITVSGLLPWNYGYDTRGRLTSVGAGDRTTSLVYDAQGNLSQVTTPDQRLLRYTYGPAGRVLTQSRPDNTLVRFQYDPGGNLTVLTSPNAVNYGFDYTGVNLRQTMTHPLSGIYRYRYDRDRRLTSLLFPSGREILNTYSQGLLTETATPEGVTRFHYSCGALLSGAVRNTEQVSYNHDGGLVTADTRSGLLNLGIGYTYNNDFRVSSISYAGETQALTYDADGLLTEAGGFTITRQAQNGLPEGLGDGALAATRTFNGYGEPEGVAYNVAGTPRYSYTLTRDSAGRITRKVETFGGAADAYDYTYDLNGRLVEARKNGLAVEGYVYEANGNRVRETNTHKGLVNQAYTQSVEDHLVTAGGTTYQFDVDGFLTGKTTGPAVTGYRYSSRGELLQVDLPGGLAVSFVHDPLGRRIAKRVNGAITEKYLWRDAATLLAVYDGSDNLRTRFTYADDRVPVSMTVSGATYYLLHDQVGSLRAVTDATGAVVKRIDYDSYGYIINDTNPAFPVFLGFAGGLHDRDVGLVRFGARDYDPMIGRWTAKDPIDFAGGDLNLFGYVGGDPVNWVDPEGLFCGSGITEYFVPDSWWGKYDFSNACEKHDGCYGTCGKKKSECDENFKTNMYQECVKLKGYWRLDCYATAFVYYQAVDIFGGMAYKSAQNK